MGKMPNHHKPFTIEMLESMAAKAADKNSSFYSLISALVDWGK
jgi:hypothetical protein